MDELEDRLSITKERLARFEAYCDGKNISSIPLIR